MPCTLIMLITLINTIPSCPSPVKFGYPQRSSVFNDWSHVRGLIQHVVNQERNNPDLWKGDYSRIMSAILPYYFHVTHNRVWIITPEFNYSENIRPDYIVFFVQQNPFFIAPYLISEIKSKTGVSWNKLLEQMWNQCDLAKNRYGKIWAVGQKGLEICLFRFDITVFQDQVPDFYTNFKPLNLSNLTRGQLTQLGLEYKLCDNNGIQRIALIK